MLNGRRTLLLPLIALVYMTPLIGHFLRPPSYGILHSFPLNSHLRSSGMRQEYFCSHWVNACLSTGFRSGKWTSVMPTRFSINDLTIPRVNWSNNSWCNDWFSRLKTFLAHKSWNIEVLNGLSLTATYFVRDLLRNVSLRRLCPIVSTSCCPRLFTVVCAWHPGSFCLTTLPVSLANLSG